jgi:hypothetical protein
MALGLTLAFVPKNSAFASPVTIPMDGYLVNFLNTPITGTTTFQFRLFDVVLGGAPLYAESVNVNVLNGNFSYNLGSIVPLDNALVSSTRWLDTTVFGIPSALRVKITDASDSPDGTSFGGLYTVFYGSAIPSTATTVPEPSTTLLLGIALTGILGYGWRRKLAM